MKTTVFDGKKFARKIEQTTYNKLQSLKAGGIQPKLVSILIGDNPASVLYTNIKKKAAERVGIEFEVLRFRSDESIHRIKETLVQLNSDGDVHGVMIQLPLPLKIESENHNLIHQIKKTKDVDGLREDSPFVPATVKAVIAILEESQKLSIFNYQFSKIVVVGSEGMVGKPLMLELAKRGLRVLGLDIDNSSSYFKSQVLNADVVISSTGVPNIIKSDMVKDGVVVIDVGSPKGDVEPKVRQKASFFTPVPGGVGPVTVACLLENLVDACYNNINTHSSGSS